MRVGTKRFLVGTGLLLAVLGATLFTEWPRISDYAQRRRLAALGEAVDRLGETHATTEEVRDLLGEPEDRFTQDGEICWVFSTGTYRGHPQPKVIVKIDPKTSRVLSVEYVIR